MNKMQVRDNSAKMRTHKFLGQVTLPLAHQESSVIMNEVSSIVQDVAANKKLARNKTVATITNKENANVKLPGAKNTQVKSTANLHETLITL